MYSVTNNCLNKTLGRLTFGCRELTVQDVVKYSQKVHWCDKICFSIKIFFSGKGIFSETKIHEMLQNQKNLQTILEKHPLLKNVFKIKDVAFPEFAKKINTHLPRPLNVELVKKNADLPKQTQSIKTIVKEQIPPIKEQEIQPLNANELIVAKQEEENPVQADEILGIFCEEPKPKPVIVALPSRIEFKEKFEKMGITWISHREHLSLNSALLPPGWTSKTEGNGYEYKLTLFNQDEEFQAEINVQGEEILVRFNENNPDQHQPEELIQKNYNLITYPNYFDSLFCTYTDIKKAIEPWGQVKAIMQKHAGTEHTFIVQFNKPIQLDNSIDGINVKFLLDIPDTLFTLRGDVKNYLSFDRFLSPNMMAFEIDCLHIKYFTSLRLWDALVALNHPIVEEIKRELLVRNMTIDDNWEEVEKKLDTLFSLEQRRKILLNYIMISGLKLVNKGLNLNNQIENFKENSPEEIVKEYKQCGWEIVNEV